MFQDILHKREGEGEAGGVSWSLANSVWCKGETEAIAKTSALYYLGLAQPSTTY